MCVYEYPYSHQSGHALYMPTHACFNTTFLELRKTPNKVNSQFSHLN